MAATVVKMMFIIQTSVTAYPSALAIMAATTNSAMSIIMI